MVLKIQFLKRRAYDTGFLGSLQQYLYERKPVFLFAERENESFFLIELEPAEHRLLLCRRNEELEGVGRVVHRAMEGNVIVAFEVCDQQPDHVALCGNDVIGAVEGGVVLMCLHARKEYMRSLRLSMRSLRMLLLYSL